MHCYLFESAEPLSYEPLCEEGDGECILHSDDIWWKAMLNLTPLIFTSSKTYYVHCQTITALDSDRKT